MSTKTAILNLALLFLGAKSIPAGGPADKNSRACDTAYDPARRMLLESYHWSFARKRATLSRLSAAPDFGWDYQFTLPSDCLVPVKVNDQLNLAQQPMWEVEGTRLLTNEETVNLNYTFDQQDTSAFSHGFCRALAALIAADISDVIKQDKGKTQDRMMKLHQYEYGKAMTIDASKGFQDLSYDQDPWNDSWIQARG